MDTREESYSYRRALVRLWVLASDHVRLNDWEQEANEQTILPHYAAFLEQLQDEAPIELDAIKAQPLALIRALDDYLASITVPDAHSNSRDPSSYQITEDGRGFWLVPVLPAARRKAVMNRQPARLARWFHRHAALPARTAHGIEVQVSLSRSMLSEALETLSTQADAALKVWVAHFDDGADVAWDQSSSPISNWRTTAVLPHPVRTKSMEETMAAARQAGAQVVVFPEFTLDLWHRKELAALLRAEASCIQLVVAGSFHEPEQAASPGIAYNTAPVFTGSGSTLLTHRKLRLFGRDDVGAEYARVGNALHVVVTPIGCMTVLICKDFMDQDARVAHLLDEVPVDWVWVPSYGNEVTLKCHKERAHQLAFVSTGTSCVVAQTQNTAMKQAGTVQALLPGFGHAAGDKDPNFVSNKGGVVAFSLEKQAAPQRPPPKLRRVK